MPVAIRRFRAADAPRLAAIYHVAVHAIGARFYTAAQCRAWSPAPPDPSAYVAKAAQRAFLVAVDAADVPIGYGDLEPDGHIDHLYCHPDHAGTGIGSAVCAALIAAARHDGIPLLYVEASEAARGVFERQGFVLEHRRDFAVAGIAIHNYRMVMPLA